MSHRGFGDSRTERQIMPQRREKTSLHVCRFVKVNQKLLTVFLVKCFHPLMKAMRFLDSPAKPSLGVFYFPVKHPPPPATHYHTFCTFC